MIIFGPLPTPRSGYLVVDIGEEFDLEVPDDSCSMTPDQSNMFVRF